MARVVGFLGRLAGDDRGSIAATMAWAIVGLSAATLGAVDVARGIGARNHLQDALDAAALAAARDGSNDGSKITAVGNAELARNLGSMEGVSGNTFSLQDNTIVAKAALAVDTIMLPLGSVTAHSEVTRGGSSVELSLVLDVTGSMSGTKLADMKVAAKDLLDIVMPSTPKSGGYYAKVALIPYSSAMNVGPYANTLRGAPISGNTSTTPGHQYFKFDTARVNNGVRVQQTFGLTTCVTERTGTHKYDDTSYSTALVGRHYAGSSNGCNTSILMPLTTDKAGLKSRIDSFSADGSTAGQIGLAWGWYMVSPTFLKDAKAILGEGMPAQYGAKNLVKSVVLMTDGMFNTAYCKGVVSKDRFDTPTNGSGADDQHINCNADNGNPFDQAKALCDAMKAKGVVVYTVGFDLASQTTAQRTASEDLMRYCATKPGNVYLPGNGVELKQAFADIGQDVSSLRLSR